ncbi:NADPH-dependent glutamate synthase [Thermincola potens]|uniref:Glutamate synthase (NADPH), homotetrameric n=1 Tax=Thermincola potens (strain JR) TaxID=635013 RepID=D5X7I6_THEPJ|nr:NADPH-dependent glutamate synthase [Thermincola potens]ADG82556.1 glutamate synthase (NADPH), homotetrameric [Thermincola potens JR]
MSFITAKHPMPEQDPRERIKNFKEVALGYDQETAVAEANRCLQCKGAPCQKGCPVGVEIPAFIKLIKEGDFIAAGNKIKERNNLPAVCGRVCPQENQCEKQCVLGKKGEPVGIGRLERFAADYGAAFDRTAQHLSRQVTGKKVAVIGSGPAGLTAAGDLAKLGYRVTVFEALHVPGGVLAYGIPEFRLPKDIVKREVDYLKSLGVEIKTNMIIGKTFTIDELFTDGFQAIFVATGAGLPYFMNIPGENLNGVFSANEFLTRTNLMKAYRFPEYHTPVHIGAKVAVIGAGNVAMDSARTALRLGAQKVTVVYRRSEKEMPARLEEIKHAQEEGVEFLFLTSPVKLIGDKEGWVKNMQCIRYELGEPDASGRRKPVAVPGSEFNVEVDTVIMAIGQGPNPLITQTTDGLMSNARGNIIVDERGQTTRSGVFAGGDIVTGAATVILAMGAGKQAAISIDQYLRDK